MQRLRRAAFPLALVAALGIAASVVVEDSAADLENLVFTSRADGVRLLVPRGWRASEQPSYPGLLLWMGRSEPQGQIVLTAEPFTHELYCSWPVPCRTSHESLPAKYACALRAKLEAQHFRVYPIQPGPKDNELAHLPSIWFEYDDGKHFLRQAIAFPSSSPSPDRPPDRLPDRPTDRAFSLVLSAPTSEARTTYTRAFEQALRTLHPLSAEETARAEGIDAAVAGAPGDASAIGASAAGSAGATLDAGATFEPAPAPKADPTGPCL